MRNRRLRQHAVAEIENKGASRESLQNGIDGTVERRTPDQQHQRIEIALNRPFFLNPIAREAKLDHPVEPNRIDGNCRNIRRQLGTGAARETDYFRSGNAPANRGDDPGTWLDTPLTKFIRRQHSRPCIEYLHRIDAGLKLPDQITRRGLDQDLDQFAQMPRDAGKQTGVPGAGRDRPAPAIM